jgi:hypothetical protein
MLLSLSALVRPQHTLSQHAPTIPYYEAAAVPSQEPAPTADLDRDLTPALDL